MRTLLAVLAAPALALVVTTPAAAADGHLTVHPGTVHPGESATACGGGFDARGDRVVSTLVGGLAGPHATVRADGTACLTLTYDQLSRSRHGATVSLAFTASGPAGAHTDTGSVRLSAATLPRTGSDPVGEALVGGGLLAVGGGLLIGSRRSTRVAGVSGS